MGDLLEALVVFLRELLARDVQGLLGAVEDRLGRRLAHDRHGRVDLAGLDPLRTMVEGKAEGRAVSEGAAADALTGLDYLDALARGHQSTRRGEAGHAGTDDRHVGIRRLHRLDVRQPERRHQETAAKQGH